jgi:hypothetical protein
MPPAALLGAVTVSRYSATDAAGNTGTLELTVRTVDTTPPVRTGAPPPLLLLPITLILQFVCAYRCLFWARRRCR